MFKKKINSEEKKRKDEIKEAKKLINKFKRKHPGKAIIKDYTY